MVNLDSVDAGNLPFIIGVSGHRDLSYVHDMEALKARVVNTLEYWRAQLTPQTPIWLLTGLATGADTLVADIARDLREKWGQSSLKVIACLPMPVKYYRQDFKGLDYAPLALEIFDEQIKGLDTDRDELLIIRSQLDSDTYQKALIDENYGNERNNLYLNQGLFIAKYSQVLIALWDGMPAEGPGGTADVVNYKLGESVEWPLNLANSALAPISEFDGQIGGAVHHIPVAEDKVVISPARATLDTSWMSGQPPKDTSIYICFNNGREHANESGREFLTKELRNFLQQLKKYNSASIKTVTPSAHKTPGLTSSQLLFQRSDKTAINYQKCYRRLTSLFFVCIVIALIVYEFASNFLDQRIGTLPILIIFISLSLSLIVARYSRKNDIK